MATFKVGDRVRMTAEFMGKRPNGTGTIKAEYAGYWAVEFDTEFPGGHKCEGKTRDGHGWYVWAECLGHVPAVTWQEHAIAGRKIEAIKQHRADTGWGLKESKDAVEDFLAPPKKPEPKFKPGDRVKCIDDGGAPRSYTVGQVYTVRSFDATHDHIQCVGITAGMYAYRFELAAVHDHIVIVNGTFGPQPATTPFVHPSREAAEAEARRLSVKSPGDTFDVWERVSRSTAPKPSPVPAPVAATVAL